MFCLASMPKRTLRIVKYTPIALGVCEKCGSQFHSKKPIEDDAELEIRAAFDEHICKLFDRTQNALRIVRENKERPQLGSSPPLVRY